MMDVLENIKKNKFEILALILSFVALFVSIKSCKNSTNANDLAKKAISSSEKQFILTNRPFVTLDSEKYEDGNYFKIERKGRSVYFEFKIKAENVGNAVAKNVMIPNKDKARVSGEEPFVLKELSFAKLDLSLAPGEDIYYQTNIELEKDTEEEAIKYYELVQSDDWEGLENGFALIYENELDVSEKYMTQVSYQILKKQVKVSKSEITHLKK